MKKSILLLSLTSLALSACGAPQPVFRQGIPTAPNARAVPLVRANSAARVEKKEGPLIENRQVRLAPTAFDAVGERNKAPNTAPNPLFQQADGIAAQGPFDTPFGELPFRNWSDFSDHVRYGYDTVYEDRKYMNTRYARGHFNKYIVSSYRQVRELYKASNTEMKRFMLLDVLVNSLEVSGRTLPYNDVHNPPAERHYKLFPTKAAMLMPTFGEIVDYNRNSYDVNYSRWDTYRAARYYQANYSRIFGLIMEHGPSKKEAWRLVHREISAYAGR